MAAGTTAGVVQGSILPGQTVAYTLGGGQSQAMILILDSPNNDVTLGVFEPTGAALVNPANKWTRWQGLLPRTEIYTILLTGGSSAEKYTLTAKVAQLVNFPAGTSSITLSGTTLKGYVFSYAFNGSAAQTMIATLNVPSTTAYLDIFGIATGSLLSSAARSSTWTGILPQTQAYVIEVIHRSHGGEHCHGHRDNRGGGQGYHPSRAGNDLCAERRTIPAHDPVDVFPQ